MRVTYRTTVSEELETFYRLLLHQSAEYIDKSLITLGLTNDQFYEAFCSRGDLRAIETEHDIAGFYWIEKRESVLHVHALILRETDQGRGLGTRVLSDLEESVSDEITILEAGVHESNLRAQRLCEKQGFVQTSYRDDVGFLVYQKHLQSAS